VNDAERVTFYRRLMVGRGGKKRGSARSDRQSRPRGKELPVIRSGDTIENPITGERLVFTATSAETSGEYVRFECFVEPSGFVAAAHLHPLQEELFEIVEGSITFKVNGQELPTRPGDRVLLPASSGTPATRQHALCARCVRPCSSSG
jgi:mannose-6-phosphate isomerase-like protein (cupin superfamily)